MVGFLWILNVIFCYYLIADKEAYFSHFSPTGHLKEIKTLSSSLSKIAKNHSVKITYGKSLFQ